MPKSFREAMKQIIADYEQAQLLGSVSAVDHTRGGLGTTITTSTAGSRPPRRGLGEVEAIVQAVSFLADAIHTSILGLQLGDERAGPRKVRAAILACRGLRPEELAAIYGRSVRSVEELRQRHGQHPKTGERLPGVLTAPASDTLKKLETESA